MKTVRKQKHELLILRARNSKNKLSSDLTNVHFIFFCFRLTFFKLLIAPRRTADSYTP